MLSSFLAKLTIAAASLSIGMPVFNNTYKAYESKMIEYGIEKSSE